MKLKQTLPVLALSSLLSLSVPSCIILDGGSSYVHEGEVIKANTTWRGSHTIKGWVTVENATLTIEPGATIRMGREASLTIGGGGRILSEGGSDKDRTIIFTADTDIPSAGYWKGIDFDNEAANGSKFSNTIFEYATEALKMDKIGASVDNCDFIAPKDVGVVLGENVTLDSFSGNYFAKMNGAYAIKAHPNALRSVGTIKIDDTASSVIFVPSGHVTSKATWKYQPIPFELENWVDLNAALTIEDSNTFFMNIGGSITVATNGAIFCEGKKEKQILFTSTASEPSAGDWNGIKFEDEAQTSSRFAYTIFEYATEAIRIKSRGASIDHCDFVAPKESGVVLEQKAVVPSFTENFFADMSSANAVFAHPEAVGQLSPILKATDTYTQIALEAGYVTKDATWVAQPVPFIVKDWLDVSENATLNIKVGEVRIEDGVNITVNNASLNIENTIFTTAHSGKQWGHIEYTRDSQASTIKNASFMNGGKGSEGALVLRSGSDVTFEGNIVFSGNTRCDFTAQGAYNGDIPDDHQCISE